MHSKVFDVEYRDVKRFHKRLNNIVVRKMSDQIFINSCERAMANTLKVAEDLTPKKGTGKLKSHWRKDVEKPERTKRGYSQTATNKAYNSLAAEIMGNPERNGYYASWVEVGNVNPAPYYEDEDGVHWISRPKGVHMLERAEQDTDDKLEGIVDKEIKKLLGGLFD